MENNAKQTVIGVIGAGTMGSGIAQVAATAGHPVVLFDLNPKMLEKAAGQLKSIFAKLIEKGKLKKQKQMLFLAGSVSPNYSRRSNHVPSSLKPLLKIFLLKNHYSNRLN